MEGRNHWLPQSFYPSLGHRQYLFRGSLDHFRRAGADPNEPEVKSAVLTIVLAYLYSGREAEAWNALEAMWPPTDRKRIQDAIVKARATGLLSQLTGKVEEGY